MKDYQLLNYFGNNISNLNTTMFIPDFREFVELLNKNEVL